MEKTLRNPQPRAMHAIDPVRIGGISSAIALHLIALALLMMPAQLPLAVADAEDRTRVVPIFDPAPPPPPPPPVEVAVVQRTPVRPAARPLEPAPVQVDPAEDVALPGVPDVPVFADAGEPLSPPGGDGAASGGDDAPVSGIALQYLVNPAPSYPRDALRDGLEGTVLLRVLVDEQGRPLEVHVERSSGHRLLDRAAREQVLRRWAFMPAQRGGRPVRAIGTVPVDFRID